MPNAAFLTQIQKALATGLSFDEWIVLHRDGKEARRIGPRTPASAAHQIVKKALRKGWIIKPDSCQVCHAIGTVEAHHPNYDHALMVEWLCRQCHIEVKFRSN